LGRELKGKEALGGKIYVMRDKLMCAAESHIVLRMKALSDRLSD
jgi:hypothetical protein